MSSHVVRFSGQRNHWLGAVGVGVAVVGAVALLLAPASANASTVGATIGSDGYASFVMTPTPDNGSREFLAITLRCAETAKQDHIMAALATSMETWDAVVFVSQFLDSTSMIQSARMSRFIEIGTSNMRKYFLTGQNGSIAVPELSSALMLVLGMIGLAAHAKPAGSRPNWSQRMRQRSR